jgi:hypothetical protein
MQSEKHRFSVRTLIILPIVNKQIPRTPQTLVALRNQRCDIFGTQLHAKLLSVVSFICHYSRQHVEILH